MLLLATRRSDVRLAVAPDPPLLHLQGSIFAQSCYRKLSQVRLYPSKRGSWTVVQGLGYVSAALSFWACSALGAWGVVLASGGMLVWR